MQQVIPGLFHWTAPHEPIGSRVSSYYVQSAGVVIDPKVPDGGLDALPGRPTQVLLSSGHHLRDAHVFAREFDIPIRASAQAVARLGSDGDGIAPWPEGAPEIVPGITALHIGVLAPDEGALHIDVGPGALALGDAVNHSHQQLAFFPDALLGDDPGSVKQGLNAALRALLDSLTFDALLFAHGEPIAAGGAEMLRRFVARGDQPAGAED
jgi:hypothetical protein